VLFLPQAITVSANLELERGEGTGTQVKDANPDEASGWNVEAGRNPTGREKVKPAAKSDWGSLGHAAWKIRTGEEVVLAGCSLEEVGVLILKEAEEDLGPVSQTVFEEGTKGGEEHFSTWVPPRKKPGTANQGGGSTFAEDRRVGGVLLEDGEGSGEVEGLGRLGRKSGVKAELFLLLSSFFSGFCGSLGRDESTPNRKAERGKDLVKGCVFKEVAAAVCLEVTPSNAKEIEPSSIIDEAD
jgi:hypothetical protein